MSDPLVFEVSFRSEVADTSEAALRAAVEDALAEAVVAAKAEFVVTAESEVEGAFGGVGEGVILVTILHILKEGGAELAKGALEATGAAFVNNYLLPVLRKRNVLPSEVKDVTPKEDESES